MKLVFDLPDPEKEVLSNLLGNETIRYCIPTDINQDGDFDEGWIVVTSTRIFHLAHGRLINEWSIKEGSNYKAVNMVGNGVLEAVFGDEQRILVRFSMTHVSRYIYIAKALNQLREQKEPRFQNMDDENRCPKCGRVFPRGSRVCPACTNRIMVAKRLWQVVKPHWPLIAVAVILFWALTGLTIIKPVIYRGIIDGFITPMNRDVGLLIYYVGAMALVDLLGIIFTILRGRIMVTASGRLSRDLRAMVYAKIQALSISYLSQRKTGDLMNRVTGDTNRIQQFLQNQAPMGINEILVLIGVSVILFIKNWKLALMIILPAPLVMFICKMFWHRIHLMFHGQWRVWDKANSMLQDILSGIKVVKTFGQEDREIKRFKKASKDFADITARNEKAWNTLFPGLGFLLGLGNFLVMYYGGHLITGGAMTWGEFVEFSQYAALIYGPLRWLSFVPRWFTEAITATERVFEIIDEEPDIKDHKHAVRHQIKGDVVFKDVTFGYNSHEPVLEEIDLEVSKGEMIGLVGHSGAGKSTLINLLMRFYDVDEGQILIDGVDIRDICQQDLRSQIGVVLQENFLFSGTILENIRYSKPDVVEKRKCSAVHFTQVYIHGINVIIGIFKTSDLGLLLSKGFNYPHTSQCVVDKSIHGTGTSIPF
jgi:ATP-binding cassette subfamily B protein